MCDSLLGTQSTSTCSKAAHLSADFAAVEMGSIQCCPNADQVWEGVQGAAATNAKEGVYRQMCGGH